MMTDHVRHWLRVWRRVRGRGRAAGPDLPPVSIVTVTRDGLFYIRLLVAKVREHIGSREYEIGRRSRQPTHHIGLAQTSAGYSADALPAETNGGARPWGGRRGRRARGASREDRPARFRAFPVDPDWLARTTDRLSETHRLGGASITHNHVGNPYGWYIHPSFMTFFKSDLGTSIVLRKVRGETTDTGEEATIRNLDRGLSVIRCMADFYPALDVGRSDVPTIAGGVVHAWYTSRLEHNEDEVLRESGGAVSRASYSEPLQQKIRQLFDVPF